MKWDHRFLDLCKVIAEWSHDPSTKVGAVIVRPDRTVCSIGYNGFPRGVIDSELRYGNRELKYKMIVHAEMNAILAAKENMTGYSIYVSPLHPCSQCAAAIIQSGIKRVITIKSDRLDWADQFRTAGIMLAEANVEVAIYH